MRVVIAPDTFKGSVTSTDAAEAIATGLRDAEPQTECLCVPMADGGEGTVAALVAILGGGLEEATVHDPLGRPVRAAYGWIPEHRLAVIEMAAASGLPLLGPDGLNPHEASSVGTGEVIRAVLDKGAREIIFGLGGSATVDGGSGLLEALGARFRDERGQPVPGSGGALSRIGAVDLTGLDARLAGVSITVACDVSNPLLGPDGAVHVFGPQKGVAERDLPRFEAAMAHWADVLAAAAGRDCRDAAGAGAAGGLGFATLTVFGAELRSGFDLIAERADLAGLLARADLAITGEGRLDAQSLFGKVPVGVARLARAAGVPVAAFAGRIDGDAAVFRRAGLDALVPIVDAPMSLSDAMADAPTLVRRAAQRFMATLSLGRRMGGGSPEDSAAPGGDPHV